jgi:hypothetical protein
MKCGTEQGPLDGTDQSQTADRQLHISRDPSRRKRTLSIAHWAALVGLADDGRSLASARALIAQGDGPEVVPVRRRDRTDTGIPLRDHKRWLRRNEWAKFLATEAAKDRRK